MNKEKRKKFLQEVKDEYKKLEAVNCPAFPNETITFNHYGLKHLLFKERKMRPPADIRRRLVLLPTAISILKEINIIPVMEERVKEKSIAYFWEIHKNIFRNGVPKLIRIVLRKLNDGPLHFFSVYDK